MKYIPYDYQEYALKFILNRKAAGIFLDCGLGKTVITLTAIAELMHNYFEIARAVWAITFVIKQQPPVGY
jgi:superfamily II DNA or RNA helicase